MTSTPPVSDLDPLDQQKLDLLHAAATELWIGPESDDVLVQVAFHAVLAWLRGVTSTPRGVLATFGEPAGPLGAQLAFVGSLLHDPETPWPSEPPRTVPGRRSGSSTATAPRRTASPSSTPSRATACRSSRWSAGAMRMDS